MPKKSISGKNIENTITSDDILGKDVIDIEGRFIGVVEKVLINPRTLDFVAIEVDKGFLKKGLTIGKSYIDKIANHAIFLKIRVVYEIKGMAVFDKLGKKIGTVSDIELWGHKNKIKTIMVNQGILKKTLQVSDEFIDTIGSGVMLNVEKKKLVELNKSAGENP